MDAAVGFLSALFWGLLTLSVLVFIHEGGHFLAARACGVRVTEFFLGLPCSKNIHRVSKRIGTKFGVTPILLGGYAAVSGMEDAQTPCAGAVLSAVHRHGTASTAQLAAELGESEEDVQEACAMLVGWGSLACAYEPDEDRRYYPASFASVPRDAAGRTLFAAAGSIESTRPPRASRGSRRWGSRPSSSRSAPRPTRARASGPAP